MSRGPYKTFLCLHCNKETRYKVGKKYCCHKCQRDAEYQENCRKWLGGEWDGNKANGTSNFVIRYIEEKFNHTCTGCGIKDWRGQRLALTVDHIDGNGYNSAESNLTLLCPNCHSQTPTFAGRNKGKGTRKYRDKYYQSHSSSAGRAGLS